MAQVLRQVSAQPGEDLLQLFKQLVFNVLMGNTDDHLKNFQMMHDDAGWKLTPAFDLVPNIGLNREHVLHINDSYLPPDRTALVREANYYLLKNKQELAATIDAVLHGVQGWKIVFRRHGVPERDIDTLAGDISERIRRVENI